MKKITVFAILAVTLALAFSLVAACGGSSNGATNTKYSVTMSGVTFSTNSLSIPKGSTITFTTQQGGTAHNLVAGQEGHPQSESGAPDFGTGGQTIGPGSSWTTSPWNTAGTFYVTCTYHPTTMNLTVTVTG